MTTPKLLAISLAVTAAFTGVANAGTLSFSHPIEANVVVTKQAPGIAAGKDTKIVTLMNINLTAAQKKHFTTFPSTNSLANNAFSSGKYPSHIDLGMNGVPALDQGRHGSCVTFATTGAIDALLGKGDYVSQLCSLELGSYLASRAYTPAGWEGSFGPLIIEQLLNFGVVNKENQVNKTCSGVKEYPLKDAANTGTPISIDDYKALSEDLSQKIAWFSILSDFERLQWSPSSEKEGVKLLDKVKETLSTRYNNSDDVRLTFGLLLPVKHCSTGACGTYHKKNDTWAITNAIKYDANIELGGHEMIITGYDDNAVSIDNEGNKHTGLLIIRNSWGDTVGDNGTYYVTYDFFKQYVMEVQAIVTTHTPIT